MTDYCDPTAIDTHPTTQPVPDRIAKLARYVRTKQCGKDVREAIAQGMEDSGAVSLDALKLSNKTDNRQDWLEAEWARIIVEMRKFFETQVGDLSDEWDRIIGEVQMDAEVVQSREDLFGVVWATLKQRLDSMQADSYTRPAGMVNETRTLLISNSDEVLRVEKIGEVDDIPTSQGLIISKVEIGNYLGYPFRFEKVGEVS